MRQSEVSEREANRRAQQSAAGKARNASMTIVEWCAHRRVSRAMFYKMAKMGIGPATYFVGTHRFISAEADAAWLSAREAESAA